MTGKTGTIPPSWVELLISWLFVNSPSFYNGKTAKGYYTKGIQHLFVAFTWPGENTHVHTAYSALSKSGKTARFHCVQISLYTYPFSPFANKKKFRNVRERSLFEFQNNNHLRCITKAFRNTSSKRWKRLITIFTANGNIRISDFWTHT